ncbi:MAG: NlpC/P60 family protein [Caulobacteraceae bacterium]
MNFDPRATLLRDGVADDRLEGLARADRYVAARPAQVIVPAASVRVAPDARAEVLDQILFGEDFERLEASGAFVLGQASRDGYVGWVEATALSEAIATPTHWVSVLRAYAFEDASIKSPARGPLSLNALVAIDEESETLARDPRIGWIAKAHISPIGTLLTDPAAVAMAHLGAPYLWGGRESTGLDCSGLVQQALLACGLACPRDSDQQEGLGVDAPPDALARGDLVFWKDHVAMMLDAERVVHANSFHMAVAVEPLAEARARIAGRGGGEPIACRRIGF